MDKKIIISFILVIAWMGLIYFFSSMDNIKSNKNSSSVVSEVINTIDKVTNANKETIKRHNNESYMNDMNTIFRKVCHAITYLILAIFVFNFIMRIMKNKVLVYNIISLLITIIYAISDEYHQTFVSGRTGQVIDILIDTGGAIIGLFIINKIINRKKSAKIVQN